MTAVRRFTTTFLDADLNSVPTPRLTYSLREGVEFTSENALMLVESALTSGAGWRQHYLTRLLTNPRSRFSPTYVDVECAVMEPCSNQVASLEAMTFEVVDAGLPGNDRFYLRQIA